MNDFTFSKDEALPESPYVRMYIKPEFANAMVFNYEKLDASLSKAEAERTAIAWLDKYNSSGYMVWEGQMIPLKRTSLKIDSDYKRWNDSGE